MAKESKFPLKVVLSAVDRLTGPLRKVGARLKSTFGSLGKKLAKVGLGVAAVGALAAVSVIKLVKSVATAGDEVAKFSARFGIGIASLQEYRFAADRVGTSQETFNKSLGAFVKRTGEAKIGTGALVTFLNKADPALLRVLKSTKTTEEALDVMFDALGRIEDPTKRAALAAAGFSRAGIAMVNFVTDGADGLKLLRQRARDLGIVMSEDAAKGSEAFVDAQTDVSASLLGLKVIIGSKLIPTLTKLSNEFVDFVVLNQEKVRVFAKDLAAKLPDAIEKIREELRDLGFKLRPVWDFFGDLNDRFGATNVVFMLLATALTVFLAPAFFAAASAALAFSIAVTANPIGLAVFLVLALIAALVALSLRMKLAGITFEEQWEKIKNSIFSKVDAIRSKIRDLTGDLPDWLVKGLRFVPIFKIAFADPNDSEGLAAPSERRIVQLERQRNLNEALSSASKEGALKVTFENAPPGTRVESTGETAIDFLTRSGFGGGL